MSPVTQFRPWWRTRSPREQLMLAVMLASLGAFALWFGLLWPARVLRDSARDGYDRAALQLREVQASAGRVAAFEQALPTPQAGPVSRIVMDSAARAGVGVSRQRQDGSDRFVVEIDSVPPQLLYAWLDTLRREHGLVPLAMRIERMGAGVRASLAFASASP